MPRLNIVKFAESCFVCYVLSLQEVIYSINVTGLKSINEQAECYLILYNVPDHQLNAATLLNLLFNLPIEALECPFGL